MANNNDVVWIKLDRLRELRFGHKAIKKMLALGSKSVEDMEEGQEAAATLEMMEEIEEVLFFGLQKDAEDNNETLTLEMMEDLLDRAESFEYVQEKIAEAYAKGMGRKSGNDPTPVKPNRATRRAAK
ncbi:hypothetical protein [Paenibacillus sp. sgz302251]|uniref:hypothetical protein n=1 Tax=Paenibacillus sp. sgz302251 TaxID=3414493 RepID=UPI003C7E8F27